MIYTPFRKEASEESLGWFARVAAMCVSGHMNRRSRNYRFGVLIAPLISRYCCYVAGKNEEEIFC